MSSRDPKTWNDVRKGHRVNACKRLMPSTGPMPTERLHGDLETLLIELVAKLVEWGTVLDPRNERVKLDNPERGSIENRARHLLCHANDDGTFRDELDERKLRSVHLLAETIRCPQMIAFDPQNGGTSYYFRRYHEFRHIVIIASPGGQRHALITQMPLEGHNSYPEATVRWRHP